MLQFLYTTLRERIPSLGTSVDAPDASVDQLAIGFLINPNPADMAYQR
jgi:hypothetical protein